MEELGPARLAEWVGAPILDAVEPYVWDASVDTIRHFARSYGDDNPLYSDPAYAAAGPWGRLVAPPLFPIAAGLPRTTPDDEAAIDLDRVGRSARQSVLADRWTLHRPIAEGVRLERERRLVDVS